MQPNTSFCSLSRRADDWFALFISSSNWYFNLLIAKSQLSFAVLKFNVREGQLRTVDFDQRIPARRFTVDAKKLPGLLPAAQPDMLYYFHQVREISELAVRAA